MKSIVFISFHLLFIVPLFCQQSPPLRMNYQAAIRQNDGLPITNKTVTLRFTVLDENPNGSILFQEQHMSNTNEFGLVNVIIGAGNILFGNMNKIQWADGEKYLKVELDENGTNDFQIISNTELVSVPYSFSSNNTAQLQGFPISSQNPQGGQALKWNGEQWIPSNDNTGGGSGPTYLAGPGISIDTSNIISNKGDIDSNNEIQTLSLIGNQITLSLNGGSITLPDASNTNEIQTLSLNGKELKLSNGGGMVQLPDDADNDPDNEIQSISISGTVLSLSKGGGSVNLPTGSGGSGDNWGTQNVEISGNTLEGHGTLSEPLKLAQQGATNGQILRNNGTTWLPGNDTDNQNLSLIGNQLNISNGTGITLPDGSVTNEIQTLSLSGTNLSLSNGGGTVTIPVGPTYSAGTGIGINGSTISNTGDLSNTNEIQSLSINGPNLSLSNNGGTVALPDGSASNEIQTLSLTGSNLTLSNGGGNVTLPDASATNEIQTISLSGSNLTLSNGGGNVTLPIGPTYTPGAGIGISGSTISNTGDLSNTNEIQTLSLSGANVALSNGGGSITLPDASNTNEIQTMSLSGNILTLSNGGGTVTLPTGPTYSAGAGIGISGSTISNTGDLSNTNEIQTLSISGNTLTLSNGGGNVIIPSSQWSTNATGIYNTSTSNVSIGSSSPSIYKLTVFGDMSTQSVYFGSTQLKEVSGGDLQLSGGDLVSNVNNQYNLGSAANYWNRVFTGGITFPGGGYIDYTGAIETHGQTITPMQNNQYDLGSNSNRWRTLYTNTAVNCCSDKRYKENIDDLLYSKAEVLKLRPVTYNLIDDKDKATQFGLIAQEVKKIIPEVVHGCEDDGMLSITYESLIPVLINAIKEQQKEIDTLKTVQSLLCNFTPEEVKQLKALASIAQAQKE